MTDNNSPGMVELTAPGANPLQKFFRQPKLYITLPSKGRWYPAGSLETTENGELAVFAMTAKDELTLKTPDALINGAATVEIIQSCVPNILNAWVMPSIDVDALLIAIRIATYGPTMDVEVTAPNTTEANNFQMDLRQVLETVGVEEFVEDVPTTTPGLQVKIRPVTYKEYTSAALQTFEEERMFRIVNDGDLEQERKLELFGETFTKIRDLTVGMISNSIVSITVDDVEVTNRVHITDFIDNADKSVFSDITKHIETEKTKHAVKPLKVFATEEQLELGAPKEFEVPIVFDQSTFFRLRIVNWPVDQILQEVSDLQGQAKQFRHSILEIMWHMRGSVSMDEAFMLSNEDRELISDIVKSNYENTKKSGLPLV